MEWGEIRSSAISGPARQRFVGFTCKVGIVGFVSLEECFVGQSLWYRPNGVATVGRLDNFRDLKPHNDAVSSKVCNGSCV